MRRELGSWPAAPPSSRCLHLVLVAIPVRRGGDSDGVEGSGVGGEVDAVSADGAASTSAHGVAALGVVGGVVIDGAHDGFDDAV